MDAVVNLSAAHHALWAPVALRESALAADTQAIAIIQLEVCKSKKGFARCSVCSGNPRVRWLLFQKTKFGETTRSDIAA